MHFPTGRARTPPCVGLTATGACHRTENERMHLMTFMEVRKATPALRGLVFVGQVRRQARPEAL